MHQNIVMLIAQVILLIRELVSPRDAVQQVASRSNVPVHTLWKHLPRRWRNR